MAAVHLWRQVLKEVRPVYKVVSEGLLNLVDKIFEMDRGDAFKVRYRCAKFLGHSQGE